MSTEVEIAMIRKKMAQPVTSNLIDFIVTCVNENWIDWTRHRGQLLIYKRELSSIPHTRVDGNLSEAEAISRRLFDFTG